MHLDSSSVSASHYEAIERALLLLSEARECAEGAAKQIADDGGQAHLVEALQATDRELLGLHRRLMDGAYFHAEHRAEQLALDAA